MTALSSSTHTETDSQPPVMSETAGKLSAEAFNNSTEFLSVLKNNFDEISGGTSQISLPDLKFEETHGSSAEIREASTIAAEHINALGGIAAQDDHLSPSTQDLEKMDAAGTPTNSGGEAISKQDLNFALDMSQGKTFWHTADNLGMDATAFMGGAAAVAAAGAALFVPTPITVPFSAFMATGGLGMMGVSAYAMDKDIHRFPEVSKQDTAMINSWLKPGS
jgi:hypothetical protein